MTVVRFALATGRASFDVIADGVGHSGSVILAAEFVVGFGSAGMATDGRLVALPKDFDPGAFRGVEACVDEVDICAVPGSDSATGEFEPNA